MGSELVRLPGDFVADVRREAEERGVTLGRVVTERAGWSREPRTVGGWPARSESFVVVPEASEVVEFDDGPVIHVHDFKYVPSISRRRCECGEIQK